MKHKIRHDNRTIYLTYIDEIELQDAIKLTEQTIQIIELLPNNIKVNFVLDISNAFITNILSLKRAATLISPYSHKMNKAYIVGSSGIQITFAKMFLKLIGSFVKMNKIKFYNTIEEADKDIDWSWQRYLIKQNKI